MIIECEVEGSASAEKSDRVVLDDGTDHRFHDGFARVIAPVKDAGTVVRPLDNSIRFVSLSVEQNDREFQSLMK